MGHTKGKDEQAGFDWSIVDFGAVEFRKEAIRCPIHGLTHMARFVVPKPYSYVVAQYVCAQCAEPHRPKPERKVYCDCGKSDYWCARGCRVPA